MNEISGTESWTFNEERNRKSENKRNEKKRRAWINVYQ
jgi:hypothetical protein